MHRKGVANSCSVLSIAYLQIELCDLDFSYLHYLLSCGIYQGRTCGQEKIFSYRKSKKS